MKNDPWLTLIHIRFISIKKNDPIFTTVIDPKMPLATLPVKWKTTLNDTRLYHMDVYLVKHLMRTTHDWLLLFIHSIYRLHDIMRYQMISSVNDILSSANDIADLAGCLSSVS